MSFNLTGGVSPTSVTLPTVGLLLRLGVACAVDIPVEDVIIASAVSSQPEVPSALVNASDVVNVQNGTCALLMNASSALSIPLHNVSTPLPTVAISLVLHSCTRLSSANAPLSQLQQSLRNTTTLNPFLSAVAIASGLAAADVAVSAPVVGPATVLMAGPLAVADTVPTSSSASAIPAWIIGLAIGGVTLLLVVVLIVVVLRRRQVRRAPLRGGDAGAGKETNMEFSGHNRMHERPVGGASLRAQLEQANSHAVHEHPVGADGAVQGTLQLGILRKHYPSGQQSTAKAVLSNFGDDSHKPDGLGAVMHLNPLRAEHSNKSLH